MSNLNYTGMEIIESPAEDYANLIGKPFHCFNSAAFNLLNKDKCDQLKFLLFRSGKIRLGLVAGIKQNTLLSPFSAPFGGFSFIDPNVSIAHFDDALRALEHYCQSHGISTVSMTLPPAFYNETFISNTLNACYRAGYIFSILEMNHSLFLEDFTENYIDEVITYNAKKNLRVSLSKDLDFSETNCESAMKTAYDVIALNRAAKGFHLRMTFGQVLETSTVIPVDSFLVTYKNVPIASAIVFNVSEKIVQVIYWGDNPEWSSYRPMNFLSYRIFEHYKAKGLKVVDIGPSSQQSVPMTGLVDFKQSIGCRMNIRFSLHRDIPAI